MILTPGTCLYRYDLNEPPTEWSADFHEYFYPDMGFKNIIGALFFYNNIDDCKQTCQNERLFEGECNLTNCQVIRKCNLLDIRAQSMIRILYILHENDIDVLIPTINTFSTGDKRPLSEIKQDFEEYLSLVDKQERTFNDDCKILNLVYKITRYIEPRNGNDSFRYLGQLLTDFDNGPTFKEKLMQKGYAGYN